MLKPHLVLIISLLILLENICAASQGLVPFESHRVDESAIRCNAIVAVEDDTGAVTAWGYFGAVAERAVNQNSITDLILVVLRNEHGVASSRVCRGLLAVYEFHCLPVFAFYFNLGPYYNIFIAILIHSKISLIGIDRTSVV